MMNAAIVGGKLQGLEACYLAKKAGWYALLIDKQIDVPALSLCDHFLRLDIHDWKNRSADLRYIDLIIPAVENWPALKAIDAMADRLGIPCLFDNHAYSISSSKSRSYALLGEIGVPVPQKWPECGFPVLLKPDGQSGSRNVQVHTQGGRRLNELLRRGSWVAEEYIAGPLYSLEVIGVPGDYEAIQVTDLLLDPAFDCKRVIAPSLLDRQLSSGFREQAIQIAEAVQLHGIMDVEAILHDGQLVTIEIDARLPSQTPTTVYWSSRCNILDRYKQILFQEAERSLQLLQENHVIYEHIQVKNGSLLFRGEHCVAHSTGLRLIHDFYGVDEAITNVYKDPSDWVATLIFSGSSPEEVQLKRSRFFDTIIDAFSLPHEPEHDVFA